eukprot:m.734752 g.734752  ORF g.734752 m.734752 type:complete len:418 (+) comp58884_c0_seq6:331-1584(+)
MGMNVEGMGTVVRLSNLLVSAKVRDRQWSRSVHLAQATHCRQHNLRHNALDLWIELAVLVHAQLKIRPNERQQLQLIKMVVGQTEIAVNLSRVEEICQLDKHEQRLDRLWIRIASEFAQILMGTDSKLKQCIAISKLCRVSRANRTTECAVQQEQHLPVLLCKVVETNRIQHVALLFSHPCNSGDEFSLVLLARQERVNRCWLLVAVVVQFTKKEHPALSLEGQVGNGALEIREATVVVEISEEIIISDSLAHVSDCECANIALDQQHKVEFPHTALSLAQESGCWLAGDIEQSIMHQWNRKMHRKFRLRLPNKIDRLFELRSEQQELEEAQGLSVGLEMRLAVIDGNVGLQVAKAALELVLGVCPLQMPLNKLQPVPDVVVDTADDVAREILLVCLPNNAPDNPLVTIAILVSREA